MPSDHPGLPARLGATGFAGLNICQKLSTCRYAATHQSCPANPANPNHAERYHTCRLQVGHARHPRDTADAV